MSNSKKTSLNTSHKRRDIYLLAVSIVVIVLINFTCSFFFHRFDLTSEKRYTLAESTRSFLKNIDDVVYIKVYLQGDFNPSFTRLKNETKEILDEFRAYSNEQIEYELIDPNENSNKEEANKLQKQLYEKGIIPEQVVVKNAQKTSQSVIWPGAIVSYKGRETVWQLFKRQVGIAPEECINNSVKELEYGLTNSIRKLQLVKKPVVAFIDGHHELDTIKTNDFMRALTEYYTVVRVNINHQLKALNRVDAIVVAQPDSMYDEKDKFIIDQFIMRGGKALWLIDPVYTNTDTLKAKGYTLGLKNETNLEDLLFKYGVRLNPVLVQDMQCASIPINIGFKKGQPNFQLFPWLYTPLILPSTTHPIVKNLDLIKFEFLSTLDTVSAKNVTKTILLSTSKYTKTQPAPARISLAMVNIRQKEEQFTNGFQPIACLLEGQFESVFKNRIVSKIETDSSIAFKAESKPTKMIVVADGDVAKNDYQRSTGMVVPLGYDMYMQQTFANKTFLLNCINYLLDDQGLLQLRAREIKLRLLDKKKAAAQRVQWQFINIGIPLILVILIGVVQFYIRKRKFAK